MATLLTATVLALPFLTGCAHSPPTRYLALNSVPAEASSNAVDVSIAPIQLTALRIPAQLDRPELVTRTAPNRYAVSETERWAAPLAELMWDTLARDLQTRLPDGAMIFPDTPAPKGTRALVVTVIDVDAPAEGKVTLQAAWAVTQRRSDAVETSGQATLYAPITGNDGARKAAALSRTLGALADRIVSSLVRR
ncbi:PqiC family protein [Caballeronia sp. AZ10_KS36]|uniref:PqiC family protein n=1 Tax=Caballeronia sp. AZ10_KS36 TaxID=2921757 RepID=UPI0020292ECF|nr:PqiC family protein [Caballeronia sp. AZ10_KS36]